jgi:hypothetical protein
LYQALAAKFDARNIGSCRAQDKARTTLFLVTVSRVTKSGEASDICRGTKSFHARTGGVKTKFGNMTPLYNALLSPGLQYTLRRVQIFILITLVWCWLSNWRASGDCLKPASQESWDFRGGIDATMLGVSLKVVLITIPHRIVCFPAIVRHISLCRVHAFVDDTIEQNVAFMQVQTTQAITSEIQLDMPS